ncbi:MAG: hypothetical protein J2P36_30070 [Ktedonobacteraceae bacterium]|nr:hypothetical protein [Ktedonobacteraceae bacterium]
MVGDKPENPQGEPQEHSPYDNVIRRYIEDEKEKANEFQAAVGRRLDRLGLTGSAKEAILEHSSQLHDEIIAKDAEALSQYSGTIE